MISTRGRRLAVALAATLSLAACTPVGGPGDMESGMNGGMDGGMGDGMGATGGSAPSGGDEHDAEEAAEAIPGAREVVVEAGDTYFEPDTLQVPAGEPVNITVTNVGNAFHDFAVTDLDVMVDVPAGTTATAGLTIEEPGEYAYECTVPGHAGAGMTGTLIVTD